MAANQNDSAVNLPKSQSSKKSAQDNSNLVQCPICTKSVPESDTKELPCSHTFCIECLSSCQDPNSCPLFGCQTTTELLVDEIDEPSEIAEKLNRVDLFGPRQPDLLKLEGRHRCEAYKGYLQCANVARMTLVECRHRVCFDCITRRISSADSVKELPHCPLARCANLLTKSEVARAAEKFPSISASCSRIMPLLSDVNDEERPTPKDEVRVYSTLYYNTESVPKPMNVPKICTVADMTIALLQLQGLDKNLRLNSIGLFIRTVGDTGRARYEAINLKTMGKKLIRDTKIDDKCHLILDPHNEVPK